MAVALYALVDLKIKPTDRSDRAGLTKNYTQRMSRKGNPGKDEYDKLKAAAALRGCPLCGHRDAETLEHQLPKTAATRQKVRPLRRARASKHFQPPVKLPPRSNSM